MLEGFEWDRRKNYTPFGSPKMILELSLAILEAQPVPAGTNKAFDFTMNTPGGEATPSGERGPEGRRSRLCRGVTARILLLGWSASGGR